MDHNIYYQERMKLKTLLIEHYTNVIANKMKQNPKNDWSLTNIFSPQEIILLSKLVS